MIREGWILADLPVGDPIQGGRVSKSDVNDLTPIRDPEGRSITNVAPVQVRGRKELSQNLTSRVHISAAPAHMMRVGVTAHDKAVVPPSAEIYKFPPIRGG